MKHINLLIVAALLGTVLAGCQIEMEIEHPENIPSVDNQTLTLTVQVSKGADDTKALALDDIHLNATWAVGELVDVYLGGTCIGTLSVTATEYDGAQATLSGKVTKTGDLVAPCTLTLLFPGRDDHAWSYLGQDGSFLSGTLAENYDYTLATLSVIEVGDTDVKVSVPISFTTQQSVYRFGFKVGGAGDPVAVKSFMVSSSQNQLVRTRTYEGGAWVSNYGPLSITTGTAPDGKLYCVSLRNDNKTEDDLYTFTVVGSDNALYEGTQAVTSGKLGNGKFLTAKKGISINKKDFTPALSGSISSVNAVL